MHDHIRKRHKVLYALLQKEAKRQAMTLDLIASENYASPAVLEALATPFTNKYAEGYPGKRYYPGNAVSDAVELRAIESAKKLFRLKNNWHVNVQPYSGSPANAEIYLALMDFSDTLMGLELSAGGHLTHGHPATFSGRAYRAVSYGVHPKTGRIDYSEVLRLARVYHPKMIISGFSAYPRRIDFKAFGEIAKKVGAYHVADISHIAGLIAAGLHPSPFPYADVVMTTTHKTLRGPRGAVIFCKKELAEKIDKAVFPGLQGGPHLNVIFAKAVAFEEALSSQFKAYQKQVIRNARALADELKKNNFKLVAGGTDTHLMLVDLRNLGIDGAEAERRLEQVGITANRNSIPGDLKPRRPSGLRLGTPALTTRGLKEPEMRAIAGMLMRILTTKNQHDISRNIQVLCKRFPIRSYLN